MLPFCRVGTRHPSSERDLPSRTVGPVKCPECAAGVDTSEKFCRACGASLKGVTEAAGPSDEHIGATDRDDPASTPAPVPPVGAPLPPPRAGSEPGGNLVTGADEPPLIRPAHDSDAVDLEELANPPVEHVATVQQETQPGVVDVAAGAGLVTPAYESYEPFDSSTDELPALFDGSDDITDYAPAREPFRIRVVFVFAVFGAVAAVMASAADIVDLFTSVPVDGIPQGTLVLEDFGTNLAVGAFIGAGVMVVGGLLACAGQRWGAGLAGGGGLALVGWSVLVLGLAETPIERAREITRNPTIVEPFTLTVTRDLGYWLVVAVGGIGLVVFLCSLIQSGSGARRGLNPWIAAVGAVAPLVLATGPLIPVNGATFADNFGIDGSILPTLFFVGRLVQVGLIAAIGAVGFLLVRNYGLGLAAGTVSVALWMWFSSLGELGDKPIGIAVANFDAPDTIPHGVTSVGAGLTVALLIVAIVVATVQPQRPRR